MNNFLDVLHSQLKNEFLTLFMSTLVEDIDYHEILGEPNENRGCYSWIDANGKRMIFTKLTQIKSENEWIVYINNKDNKLFKRSQND